MPNMKNMEMMPETGVISQSSATRPRQLNSMGGGGGGGVPAGLVISLKPGFQGIQGPAFTLGFFFFLSRTGLSQCIASPAVKCV